MLAFKFRTKLQHKPTNTWPADAIGSLSGIEGTGLSIGNGCCCCFCAAEATLGLDRAKNESNNPAVTLPAEWHIACGFLRICIFVNAECRQRRRRGETELE